MGLLELAAEVKAGKRKLSDLRPGIQPMVKRLIPVLTDRRAKPTFTASASRTAGVFTARNRRARST